MSKALQLNMFSKPVEWRPPAMDRLPSWADAKRIGIDIETCDPQLTTLGPGVRRDGRIVGVSFAIEEGPKFYLPVGHEGGGNLDKEQVFRYLRHQAKNYTGITVGANINYDLDYLCEEGIDLLHTDIRDVQVADPLLYELHNAYSLKAILDRLGVPSKDETELRRAAADLKLDPKKDLWRLHAGQVAAYAEWDAAAPLVALRKQESRLDEANLMDIYHLECKVTPILLKMRRRGVLIDWDKLDQIEKWSREREQEALNEVFRISGHRIALGDVWRVEPLANALTEQGYAIGQTAKGGPSVDQVVLRNAGELGEWILKARKVNKIRTTFAASLRRYQTNGRIHCTFNQIAVDDGTGGGIKGARYGRLSAVDPNLQQQPSRDEFKSEDWQFAAMWRSVYIPDDPSLLWATLDYSQQEPRWTTHYAEKCNFARAQEAAQRYRDDPSTDNHQMMADLTGLPRKAAKPVFLGLVYGEGGGKLCLDLAMPIRWCLVGTNGKHRQNFYFDTKEEALEASDKFEKKYVFMAAGEEGQAILDKFDAEVPYIRELSDYAKKMASQRGYVVTRGGRRLNFPRRPDGSYDFIHKALNRIIQGSSADQTKTAMVMLDAEGFPLQLQVHDEFDLCLSSVGECFKAAKVMEEALPGTVPSKVDIEVGPSWGEIMNVEKWRQLNGSRKT